MNQVSLCPSCNCMTKTVDGKCGKCGENKTMEKQWELAKKIINIVWEQDFDEGESVKCNESNSADREIIEKVSSLIASELSQAKAEQTEEIEYLNIEFNPKVKSIASVLVDVGNWEFIGAIAVTDYSWIAKFSRISLHLKESEKV